MATQKTLEKGLRSPEMNTETTQGRLRQYCDSGYVMTCFSIEQNAMFLAIDFGSVLAMEGQGTPDGCVPRN